MDYLLLFSIFLVIAVANIISFKLGQKRERKNIAEKNEWISKKRAAEGYEKGYKDDYEEGLDSDSDYHNKIDTIVSVLIATNDVKYPENTQKLIKSLEKLRREKIDSANSQIIPE